MPSQMCQIPSLTNAANEVGDLAGSTSAAICTGVASRRITVLPPTWASPRCIESISNSSEYPISTDTGTCAHTTDSGTAQYAPSDSSTTAPAPSVCRQLSAGRGQRR